MSDPILKPFLDWYGIWPSHRKEEDDGRVWSQDPPQGVQLTIEPAHKSEVFFAGEHPWEREANLGIVTVLHEAGRYRLWYAASKVADPAASYVCYAESDDGLAWQRPELGLCEYEGSARNNILCCGRDLHLGSVFMDPSAPPEERYKAIAPRGRYYRDGQPDPDMTREQHKALLADVEVGGVDARRRAQAIEVRMGVCASVSPDGIHWRNLADPILDVGASMLDTHNLASFDASQGQYVAYLRGHLDRRRLIRRSEGDEFTRLGQPRPCLMCDTQDPVDDDMYNSCYCPYPGQPLHLMFPSIYHRMASTVDIQLAVSRDGYLWTRPERRPIIDRSHEEGEYGTLYASPDLVAPGNGEWRLAFVANQRRHDFLRRGRAYPQDGEIRWAVWREDRLAGLEALSDGVVTLVQRQCAGRELRLNYRTEDDGWVKVELVNLPETPPVEVLPFEGFSLGEAETLTGDELSRLVRWRGKSDLSSLQGTDISVRLHLHRAKVFAITF